MNQHDEVINYMQQLPIEEVVDIFQKLFQERIPAPEEAAFRETRFCIAVGSRDKNEATDSLESAEIMLVAYPKQNNAPDWGLCQAGICLECGVSVCSNAKSAECPVCSNDVYLT